MRHLTALVNSHLSVDNAASAEKSKLNEENEGLKRALFEAEERLHDYSLQIVTFEAKCKEEVEGLQRKVGALTDQLDGETRRCREARRECERLNKAKRVRDEKSNISTCAVRHGIVARTIGSHSSGPG